MPSLPSRIARHCPPTRPSIKSAASEILNAGGALFLTKRVGMAHAVVVLDVSVAGGLTASARSASTRLRRTASRRLGFGLHTPNGASGGWRAHLTRPRLRSCRQRPVANPHVRGVLFVCHRHSAVGFTPRDAGQSRYGRFLESVLADPQMELRARQPKPPRGFRFVSSAFLQDLGDRGAFESAQIGGVRCGVAWHADCSAKWSVSMGAPSQRIAARSKTLRSSRTFPGHWYWRSACRASRVRPAAGRPKDLPISCRKVSLSGTMSADARATAESGCRRRRGGRTGPRESRRARRLCADRGSSRR